jgi:hypothetical protein
MCGLETLRVLVEVWDGDDEAVHGGADRAEVAGGAKLQAQGSTIPQVWKRLQI